MKRVDALHFRVLTLEHVSEFYCGLLGMQKLEESQGTTAFGFDANRCKVEFRATANLPYESAPNDFYWKIGITLRDLDVAVEHLRNSGLVLPDPYQFRDIGYMTKLTDPNGFNIELLQQGFEGNTKALPIGHPIGAQATLAHLTLRVTDIASARNYFENTQSMRLMSVQPVDEFGFCLYFYTWSDEVLPNPDLRSVDNREWLWSRPYTFVELQHLTSPGATVQKTPAEQCGFDVFSSVEDAGESSTCVAVSDLHEMIG